MPKIARNLSRQAPGSQRSRPSDFGGAEGRIALGRAIGDAGSTLTDIGVQIEDTKNSSDVAARAATIQSEIHDLTDSIRDDKELKPEEHEAEYQKRRLEIINRNSDGLNKRWRGVFDQRTAGMWENGRVRVKQNVHLRNVAIIQSNRAQEMLGHERNAIRAGSAEFQEMMDAANDSLEEQFADGSLKNLALAKDTFLGNVLDARADALIDLDAEDAAEALKDPKSEFAQMDEAKRLKKLQQAERMVRVLAGEKRAAERWVAQKAGIERTNLERVTFASAVELMSKGEMTPLWLSENRGKLSKSQADEVRLSIENRAGGLSENPATQVYHAAWLAMTPHQRATTEIDIPLAGNKLAEIVTLQTESHRTKQVSGVQAQINAALERPPFKGGGIAGVIIRGIGLTSHTGDTVSVDEESAFLTSVHEQVQLEINSGHPPGPDRVEKIINDRIFELPSQGKIDLWFTKIDDFGSVPFFKTHVDTLEGSPTFGKRVDKDGTVVGIKMKNTVTGELIPDHEVLNAMFTIRNSNLDPTVELIQDLYSQWQNQPRSKRQ